MVMISVVLPTQLTPPRASPGSEQDQTKYLSEKLSSNPTLLQYRTLARLGAGGLVFVVMISPTQTV
jgi:hypothetical protein